MIVLTTGLSALLALMGESAAKDAAGVEGKRVVVRLAVQPRPPVRR